MIQDTSSAVERHTLGFHKNQGHTNGEGRVNGHAGGGILAIPYSPQEANAAVGYAEVVRHALA